MKSGNRFQTYWDESDERADQLERELSMLEVDNADLREAVEQAYDLLKVAEWQEQGDYYDAMHLLAEIDAILGRT